MRRGGIDQQRGGESMRQPFDLHAIIVNRNGKDASFPCKHELSGSRISWFLKPNGIAGSEGGTHDEVKSVRGCCCNENVLWGTSQAARSSKIGSKRFPKRRVSTRGAIAIGGQTSSHRSPRLAPETRGKGRDGRHPQSKRDSLRGHGLLAGQWRSFPRRTREGVRRWVGQTWQWGKISYAIGS